MLMESFPILADDVDCVEELVRLEAGGQDDYVCVDEAAVSF